eukprot:NODE_20884_length_778_cov_1.474654.p1 GENE.NODE_20884_length_778_cov_1.474654~~NODE_20884_length_778_cov_1.474654.p1  ORF type:complete len:74 (+),score=4.93 NODE_20884_length_778_cov_1.474654:151-372(+)
MLLFSIVVRKQPCLRASFVFNIRDGVTMVCWQLLERRKSSAADACNLLRRRHACSVQGCCWQRARKPPRANTL